MKTYIFSILCENEPGVMMRISRIYMRRQVNIDSITVGMEPSGLARIILMFKTDSKMAKYLYQVIMRLNQVIEVEQLDESTSIVREIALIKTKPLSQAEQAETLHEIERVGGRVLQIAGKSIIAELHGHHARIERIIQNLGSKKLKEVARSGQVFISRSEK